MKLLAAFLVSTIALQGCVTDEGLTGTGPVTLTDRQKTHFNRWKTGRFDRDPLYFFLVRGGASYGVYCPDTAALCREASESRLKEECDAKYGADACKLYAVFGDVVWKFNEPVDQKWSNLRSAHTTSNEFVDPQDQFSSSEDVRRFRVRWSGYSGTLEGTLHYRSSRRNYELIVLLPDETYCEGAAEFTRKTWRLYCRNDISAEGIFHPSVNGEGALAKGVDSRGNRIEFRVGPERS